MWPASRNCSPALLRQKQGWANYLQAYLGSDFFLVASVALRNTALCVLAKRQVAHKITNIETSLTGTPLHEALPGAVSQCGGAVRQRSG